MTTTFGLTLPQRGVFFGVTTMPKLLESARRADESGQFSMVWVGDSLTAKPRPDSLSLLGALAGATSHVDLAVGCMASFPVRDPLVFAYQWATLDQVSGGRMKLAACTGLVPQDQASLKEGAHWSVSDRSRAARLEENIEICRQLWTHDDVSFNGRYRSFEHLTIQPKPLQQPCPIWIAANPMPGTPSYRRALERVAQKADGWMTVRLHPAMLDATWPALKALLVERQRDPATFPVLSYHNVNINEDASEALDESQRFLDAYYGPVFTPDMVRHWTAHGSPEQVIDQLRELAQSGATHITLRITSWDQEGQFHRLTTEVLPKLGDG